jgi:hypothetical protein
VTTTVCASGAVAVIGLPLMLRVSSRMLFDFGSNTAAIENSTSAEVNGVPSDQVTSGRRCSVWVRPSSPDSHRSASHGSSSNVARLTRTSRPCVRVLMTSVVWSRAAMRLNERGSPRRVPTIWPPRAGGPSSLLPVVAPLDLQSA